MTGTTSSSPAGFREIEHTADWAIEVWAPDLAGLLEHAARGMYALLRLRWAAEGATVRRPVRLSAPDPETLLVDFLSELLFVLDTERVAFDEFALQATPTRVQGRLRGRPVVGQEKEIKAVTYHNLRVERTAQGWRAVVTFDV
ncbi:MAG: archease [Chloroflexi bacterium]|nr:archease [Chloroflexota bacterium]